MTLKHYRKYLVAAAQAAVSIAVLGLIASRVDVADSMASITAIPLATLVLATAIVGLGFVASALRWGAVLRNVSITLPSWRLVSYYLMGLFFSLFLPTSVGGDAFRVYVVARRSEKFAAAFFATMQDRLLGLCGAMAVSLAVMPAAGHVLPREFLPSILAIQCGAVAATVFALYPPLILATLVPFSRWLARIRQRVPRLHSDAVASRVEKVLASLGGLMRTRPTNVPLMLVLALLPAVIIPFAYQVILAAMGIEAKSSLLMLIIPMVWIVRLLPISLGGIGLGEGAFVLLAAFAGIDRHKAFAAALAILAIQIGWALLGGILLLRSGLKRAFAYSRRY